MARDAGGKIQKSDRKGVRKLRLPADMTIYAAAELKPELQAALQQTFCVEVDCSAVTELDTAGMQLLVMMKQEALRGNTELQLVNHSNVVTELLDLYGLAGFFGDPIVMH